jgi:hypothetical protein
MGQVCTVCAHEDAVLINEDLVLHKTSNRSIANQYGVGHSAVQRHREHIPQLLVKASQAMEVGQADDLLAKVEELRLKAMEVLTEAEEAHDHRVMLAAIDRASKQLELLAKLLGELQQEGTSTINLALVDHPDYARLSDAILGALVPHGDARYAVAEALREIE